MANNQSETPAPTTPAQETAVEAGKAVEGAVAASSNPAEYTEPTAGQKADLEDDLFGGESERVVEPVTPATGKPGEVYEPQGIIASHP
ncbi:hypothetical protein [Streptomyces sp. CB01881]|uniref:hypothetical protein n=1 Tax=Streptomyces sp. CB01881 TaxID=2078691 RepID=UPI000CDCBE5B|nr:hypothetical protein [Streptomyces sp. CB01881]AUY50015.1 hypothetical protein C2142_15020 [Streptomyces sp. CB01881]TYC73412.1 hypothetical protein EH183_15005 [Streptomyces sp. CB01881]